MNRYLVQFSGTVEVEAESDLEAECNASFNCSPDNCVAIELLEGEEPE